MSHPQPDWPPKHKAALDHFVEIQRPKIGKLHIHDGEADDGTPLDWCDECMQWIQREGHHENCAFAALSAIDQIREKEGARP